MIVYISACISKFKNYSQIDTLHISYAYVMILKIILLFDSIDFRKVTLYGNFNNVCESGLKISRFTLLNIVVIVLLEKIRYELWSFIDRIELVMIMILVNVHSDMILAYIYFDIVCFTKRKAKQKTESEEIKTKDSE